LGAIPRGKGRCRFRVWAPGVKKVEVRFSSPRDFIAPLQEEGGYHQAVLEGVNPGSLYFFRLDGEKERPDPASRFQPQGVHGPSQVVDAVFPWEDQGWFGLPLWDYVIYELHVGAFSSEATFEGAIPYLDELKELGVTAVELMPVAQFPGARNWGYDGVFPFAVQNSYGGPGGLKRLVNECHKRGLAVVLDVVYNHLGPEGNYLRDFGPYFTDRYRSPWGQAVNFDGPENREVRRFFIENALCWITDFHIDALRLDAVHAILDFSAEPFLKEMAEAVHEQADRLNRCVHLIAESDLNDTRLLRSSERGGCGLDGQWSDDFHHSLHTLLTGEDSGYYQDFGRVKDLKAALSGGLVYEGRYSSFRKRLHGNSFREIPATRLVVFSQNHDQVGNRLLGERLSRLTSFEGLKLAAGVVFLSPYVPLLFMGEEYGEEAPFPYFISHGDPELVEAVRRGRREEFSSFQWAQEPPDPQDEGTFRSARLDRSRRGKDPNRSLYRLYRELLALRKSHPVLSRMNKDRQEFNSLEEEKVLVQRRWEESDEIVAVYHFGETPQRISLPLPQGEWNKLLDSADTKWAGPGTEIPPDLPRGGETPLLLSPQSFFLLAGKRSRP
jgi:maltooligosyltrehalose trehalohydrolase